MDYILEMDMLNEASQFDMGTAIVEQFELSAIKEGFSKESVRKVFRKIIETVTGWATNLKNWAAKIFKPVIDKYKTHRISKLKAKFENGKTVPLNATMYFVNVKVYNTALEESDSINNNALKAMTFLDTNMTKFLYQTDGNKLDRESFGRSIKTDKSQLKPPVNKIKDINDLLEKQFIARMDRQMLMQLLDNEKRVDKCIEAVDNSTKNTLNLYTGINQKASKYENMMSRDENGDIPGTNDVIHAYNILLKSVALGGQLLNSCKAALVRTISEYTGVVSKLMKVIGVEAKPASSAGPEPTPES